MARSSDRFAMRLTLTPERRLELVHGDHGPRPDLDDLAVYPVILELLFEYPRVRLGALFIDLDLLLFNRVEQRDGRQFIGADLLQEIERLLHHLLLFPLFFLLFSLSFSSTILTGFGTCAARLLERRAPAIAPAMEKRGAWTMRKRDMRKSTTERRRLPK